MNLDETILCVFFLCFLSVWVPLESQALVSRLYFFVGSGGLNTQYATTNSPLGGTGIILNSHADLEEVGREGV